VQVVVEHELPTEGSRDQLYGAIVVGRSETARDRAQIGSETLPEGGFELVGPVADNRDPCRLESQRKRFLGEERPV
jgi:hypothetical protein